MLKLLKIEWMKIKSYKVFLVFSILYAVALLLTTYVAFKGFEAFSRSNATAGMVAAIFNPFKFPVFWSNAAFFLGLLVYFPCIIVITFCVNEFTFKTHRQNIIDGWSRTQFWGSKLILLLLFSIFITLLYAISVYGFSLATKVDFSTNGAEAIGYFFMQTFYYLLVAFTCALLFRKSGIAIMVFLLYAIVVENILFGLLNNYFSPAGYFLPLQVADSFTPLMVEDPQNDGKAMSIYKSLPNLWIMGGTFIGYVGLWLFLGYKKFVKDDL